METTGTVSKWLIRVYALIVLVVAVGDIFEGSAFTLIISLLVLGIITQTFLLPARSVEKESKQDQEKDTEVMVDRTS